MEFKCFLKATFDGHCETRQYTLKLHLVDNMVYYSERYGFLEILDASSFERIYIPMRLAYRTTSQGQS